MIFQHVTRKHIKTHADKTREHSFFAPVMIVRGALRIAPICPSVYLSVRPFVTLYGIEYVFSLSFQWIFSKPCVLVMDIMKICIWIFDVARINFERNTAFRTSFFCIVWYEVCVIKTSYSFQWIVFETLHTSC